VPATSPKAHIAKRDHHVICPCTATKYYSMSRAMHRNEVLFDQPHLSYAFKRERAAHARHLSALRRLRSLCR
jgi:hypothetical protein